MPLHPFKFAGQYYTERNIQIDNQKTINMYAIKDEYNEDLWTLANLPGLGDATTIPNNSPITTVTPMRGNGLFSHLDHLYEISGENLYRDGELIPFIIPGPSPPPLVPFPSGANVRWTNIPTQIGFCVGSNLYVINITPDAEFTEVTNLPDNQFDICVLNGRAYVIIKGTNQFYVSDQGDISKYDPGRYALFTAAGDTLMGCASFKSRLFLFGRFSTESWYPSPTVDIPVVRDPNYIFQWGTPATYSIVEGHDDANNSLLAWLAQDKSGTPSFICTYGVDVETISNPPIVILLQNFSELSDAVGYSYKIDGHLFFEWSFATANKTLVYDATMKAWFTREMLNTDRFIGNSHAYFHGEHYIGSRVDNRLYKMAARYLMYGDENIHRQRISNILHSPNLNRRRVDLIELKFITGDIPLLSTDPNQLQGTEFVPYAYLSVSRDYQPFDMPRKMSIGKTGQYRHKTQWRGLGIAYAFCFKLDLYDPIRTYITGCSISDMEFGS